ncbi:hypothetical protein ACROYT_G036693 [Oculina patagonica]
MLYSWTTPRETNELWLNASVMFTDLNNFPNRNKAYIRNANISLRSLPCEMAARLCSYWGKYQQVAIMHQLSIVYSNSLTTGERYPGLQLDLK